MAAGGRGGTWALKAIAIAAVDIAEAQPRVEGAGPFLEPRVDDVNARLHCKKEIAAQRAREAAMDYVVEIEAHDAPASVNGA